MISTCPTQPQPHLRYTIPTLKTHEPNKNPVDLRKTGNSPRLEAITDDRDGISPEHPETAGGLGEMVVDYLFRNKGLSSPDPYASGCIVFGQEVMAHWMAANRKRCQLSRPSYISVLTITLI